MQQEIIAHGPGMIFHVVNLIVMVLMPMVVINVKETGFSLGKCVLIFFFFLILNKTFFNSHFTFRLR